MSGDPGQISHELATTGAKHVYVDGGIAVQEFLRAGPDPPYHHHAGTRVDRRRHSFVRQRARDIQLRHIYSSIPERLGNK